MINSSKQSKASNLFQSKIFGQPELNDDIEAFELHRITSDIEKLFCDDENFDEFQEEYLVTETTESLNAENPNSNNNSIIANGNIWQNLSEKGDDSFILAEKFENLKMYLLMAEGSVRFMRSSVFLRITCTKNSSQF